LLLAILALAIVLNVPRWIEAQQYISNVVVGLFWHWDGVKRQRLVFHRSAEASGFLRYRYYRQYYHGLLWITFMFGLPILALTILNFKILKQVRNEYVMF